MKEWKKIILAVSITVIVMSGIGLAFWAYIYNLNTLSIEECKNKVQETANNSYNKGFEEGNIEKITMFHNLTNCLNGCGVINEGYPRQCVQKCFMDVIN